MIVSVVDLLTNKVIFTCSQNELPRVTSACCKLDTMISAMIQLSGEVRGGRLRFMSFRLDDSNFLYIHLLEEVENYHIRVFTVFEGNPDQFQFNSQFLEEFIRFCYEEFLSLNRSFFIDRRHGICSTEFLDEKIRFFISSKFVK